MLIQRSREFSDNESKKIAEKNDRIIEELLDQNKTLMELNMRMKASITNLVGSYKNNDDDRLLKLLESLSETNFEFEEYKQFHKTSLKNSGNFDLENSMNHSPSNTQSPFNQINTTLGGTKKSLKTVSFHIKLRNLSIK